MKKRIMTILAGFFALNAGFAYDITVAVENPALSGLLAQLQTSIKAKPELLDHYLNVMQGIATQQEQELHVALQAQDQQKITTLTQNREVMRQVNAALYDAKEQQNQKKAEFAGNLYTFKSQALMPRLSMSWGDKEYFAFPSNQTYVQLNWSQNIS